MTRLECRVYLGWYNLLDSLGARMVALTARLFGGQAERAAVTFREGMVRSRMRRNPLYAEARRKV